MYESNNYVLKVDTREKIKANISEFENLVNKTRC